MSETHHPTRAGVAALADAAPGTLLVHVGDREIVIDLLGDGSGGDDRGSTDGRRCWTLPVGVETLVDGPLGRADRPRPEQLTNALGIVNDHLEDVLIEEPAVASAPAIVFTGRHACTVSRVELGVDDVPDDYVLRRADADEVFRTIVAERRDDRAHNPGLPEGEVDTVVAGCCAVLAVLRRLDHHQARVVP